MKIFDSYHFPADAEALWFYDLTKSSIPVLILKHIDEIEELKRELKFFLKFFNFQSNLSEPRFDSTLIDSVRIQKNVNNTFLLRSLV